MNTVWQDLRYGARMLSKQPGFALIAVITLALGIGANTTMFNLVDALLLKPLPGAADPDRLVQIGRAYNSQGFSNSAYADYRDFRDQSATFTGIASGAGWFREITSKCWACARRKGDCFSLRTRGTKVIVQWR
jgi:hypothetical protein